MNYMRKQSNRSKLQKSLSKFTSIVSILSIFLAGLAVAYGWGIELTSLFTISAYFFGLTYAILPTFFSSFGSRLFGASFLALFTAPTIVYSIVIFIILINKRDQLIIIADSNTWILFAGSVIGGLMTMLAVYFSIKSSENSTKQQVEKINEQVDLLKIQNETIKLQHNEQITLKNRELANNAIPIVNLQIAKHSINQQTSEVYSRKTLLYLDENIDVFINLPFQLINLSSYSAKSLRFNKFKLFTGDAFLIEFDQKHKQLISDKSHDINMGSLNSRILPGNFNIPFEVDFTCKPEANTIVEIDAELEYKDFYEYEKHTVQIKAYISFKILEEIHIDDEMDQYQVMMYSISNIEHEFKK